MGRLSVMIAKKDQDCPWILNKALRDDSEQGTATTEYSSDNSDYDSSDYSDSYDGDETEFDALEMEVLELCCNLQRLKRRNSAGDALAALMANSNQNKVKRPDLVQAYSMNLFQRMAEADKSNSYLQDPKTLQHKASLSPPSETTQKKPAQFLKETLATQYTTESTFRSSTWEAYFTGVTPERMAAHSLVIATAIRKANLSQLRDLLAQGARLDGCNKQGESSMHLACRLSNLQVAQLLMEDAQVSVRVRDDCGRTPLHDACWTSTPNFELVKYILDRAPELLFLEDHRGFTALAYVPACSSKVWCDWIAQHKTWLQQKVHNSSWLKASKDLDQAQLRMRRLMERAQSFYAVAG